MATPRHHDPLQGALQSLSFDADDLKNSSCSIATSPTSRLDHHPDSPLRKSAPQRQYLRQRRPESLGPHDSLERNGPPALSSTRSRARPLASFDDCGPSFPDRLHAVSFPPADVHHANSFLRDPRPSRAAPSEEGKDGLGSKSPWALNAYPLDYKAAVLREISGSHHQRDSDDHYSHCNEDDKQKACSEFAGTETAWPTETVDGSDAVVLQAESGHMVASFSNLAIDKHEVDSIGAACQTATEQALPVKCQYQELHRDLSKSSSDDSFCHISKEAVEWEYKTEFHLVAPLQYQAVSEPCPCANHVYDYSSAGITLVEGIYDEDHSGKSFDTRRLSSHNAESAANQESKVVLDDQRTYDLCCQDIESPPLFLGFNHNSTRFVCCTSTGFRVYDIDTGRELFSCIIGGVSVAEFLPHLDLLFLVGGGPNPSFPIKSVVMWDAINQSYTAQVSHKFPILAVKARFDKLVVVLENEICVYNFRIARLLFRVQTISNIKGLCAISLHDRPLILACLGARKGQVRIEHVRTDGRQGEQLTRNSLIVSAHDSGLACLALSPPGTFLATASDRGTLVRIFSTENGAPLQEVRRGLDRAEIYSLAFSFSSDWLALSSDKGTVHIFGVRVMGSDCGEAGGAASLTPNLGSTFSFIKGVLPKYFKSEWSSAQFRLPQEMKSVISFPQEKGRIFVLCTDGSFYKLSFDSEHGGDMKQLEFLNFLKPAEKTLS